jgi:hypothetical protein
VAEEAVVQYGVEPVALGGGGRRVLGGTPERLAPAAAGDPFVLTTVGSWKRLAPGKRPPSYCPVCLERVTLKLGSRNRHHYAHRPESACPAAGVEGALHLAAKLAHPRTAAGAPFTI